jgi:hypothetical protein
MFFPQLLLVCIVREKRTVIRPTPSGVTISTRVFLFSPVTLLIDKSEYEFNVLPMANRATALLFLPNPQKP